MKRFLVTKLLIIAVFTSCSLKTTEGLRETQVTKKEIVNPYFSSASTDYVYKAKIDIYGKYFGGILILKKVAEDTHRIVFTTEFGSKIFDFLFEGDTFTKNYILEDLDKKLVVNTLRKDFKLLITENMLVEQEFASDASKVFRTEADGRFNFYYFDQLEENLTKIVNTSKIKEKVTITFDSIIDNCAQSIIIEHQNIKLNIDLEYLKKD